MSFLLDTVTISEGARPTANRGVVRWLDTHHPRSVFLSCITLGEIERGLVRLPPGARRNRLRQWSTTVVEEFEGRILAFDSDVARRWGRLMAELEASGEVPEIIDSLIAATALVHDLTVVTRNVGDFARCGVPVVNPWEA